MNSQRVFYSLMGLITLVAATGVCAAVLGTTLLKSTATELMDLKVENQVIENQQQLLVQAKKDIEKYAELNKNARAVVPQDKDQARTVRELTAIAAESGINIANIKFPTSSLGVGTPPPASGSSTPATSPSAPEVSQVKPVSGMAGVYSLEVTLTPADAVSYPQLISFLKRLEVNRRTSHVQNIAITPDKGSSVNFTLTLNSYIRP